MANLFVLPDEFGERIEQALAQRVCTAADGSYIRRSYGRRKSGRGYRYFIHFSNERTITIIAANDNRAVEIANEKSKILNAGT